LEQANLRRHEMMAKAEFNRSTRTAVLSDKYLYPYPYLYLYPYMYMYWYPTCYILAESQVEEILHSSTKF
jgi:hypothetical protein